MKLFLNARTRNVKQQKYSQKDDFMEQQQELQDDLLFYDVEVFSQNAFVVFKSIDKKLKRVFHNNFVGLSEFIKGKTLVGFNNYHYDDKILTYMLDLKTVHQIKDLNDRIIGGENVDFVGKAKFNSLDTFQQLDVSRPSLKKIEGNYGRMILESSVPFTIDRPLTEEEFQDVLNYCIYDVDTTIDVYKIRLKSYFKPKLELVNMLKRSDAIKWNTTTISANLLMKKPRPKWSHIKVPEWMMDLVPPEVKELWMNKDKGSVTIHEFENEIQFGFGGLHGAHTSIKNVKGVKLLDVTSMYPNIILLLKVLGEKATEQYKEILDRRIEIKHVDKTLSDALKLILNSVYGNLNNQYSTLFNPKGALSVCVFGQIALFELCRRISPFCTILNINTDGVAFIPKDDRYIQAHEQWQEEFLLQLEEQDFEQFIQKDVNNYIAVQNGNLICKGADVNRYHSDALFKQNNARILDIALVDHLVHGKKIWKTLKEHLDQPHLFQYILKAGSTYKGTFDKEGNQYNNVNRVFASKEEGFCLYKRRHDDGLVRFADAPLHMYLFNNDCSEIDNFEEIVDLNHYYQLIIKRLERWM
jgi:hypothetical protein